ncbi:MAG: TonB-dependent receptor, partial [Acidobacteriota bacterium]
MPIRNLLLALALSAAVAAPTFAAGGDPPPGPAPVADGAPADRSSWILEEEIDVEAEAPDENLIERESDGATRTRTPLVETPQSIQVLNRRLLEEQQVRTLDQALVNVSGVVPSRPEELVLQQPLVRGFASEIFIDGLQAFGLTPVVDPTSTINVERIEVLKGPSSGLFGGGVGAPLGGLINIVSKRPLDEARYGVELRLGEFETRGAAFDLNVPTGPRSAFRVTGEVEDSESYIDAVEQQKYAFFPTFATRLGDRTRLTMRAQVSRVENLEYVGLPASIAVAGDFSVDPDRFSGATDAPLTVIENQLLTARLDHRFRPGLDGVLEARYYNSSFEEFSTFPFFAFFPPDPDEPTRFAILSGQLPTDVEQRTLSSRVEWSFGAGETRHRLLAGVELDRTDYDAATGFNFSPIGVLDYADRGADLQFGEIPPLTSFFDDTFDTLAVYVQDQISFGPVRLLAGLRATRLRVEQRPNLDETYDELTPRLGLSVDLGVGVAAFAGYSEGFRGVLFFQGPEGSSPVPESSEHTEVGFKWSRADLEGSVALYELVRSNVPAPDPRSPFVQVQ